ncbi:MAG: hypothetical protein PWP39_1631, partial [Pyrococcus sp.]|nr:hypothetical protein [Pyrococcus sp.]
KRNGWDGLSPGTHSKSGNEFSRELIKVHMRKTPLFAFTYSFIDHQNIFIE